MWKRFINVLVAALLLLLIALALRLIAAPWSLHFFEHYGEQPSDSQPAEDSSAPGVMGDLPNWLQFGAAIPIALFSFWLFRLGRLQSHLLKRANRTAAAALNTSAEALNETKRSVDAFIEAERGRLVIHSVVEQPDGTGGFEFHFVIENVGRGLCTITGEWVDVDHFARTASLPTIDPPLPMTPTWQPIPAQGRVTTGGPIGVDHRRPLAIPPNDPARPIILYRHLLRYETSFGKERLAGFTFCADPATSRIVRPQTVSYNFDYPSDFDFSTRP